MKRTCENSLSKGPSSPQQGEFWHHNAPQDPVRACGHTRKNLLIETIWYLSDVSFTQAHKYGSLVQAVLQSLYAASLLTLKCQLGNYIHQSSTLNCLSLSSVRHRSTS